MDQELPEGSELVITDTLGIYIPRAAVKACNFDMDTVSQEDLDICRSGPHHEHYWEAWDNILQSGMIHDNNPITHLRKRASLYQEGDLWAIPEGAEWPEET